MILRRSVTVLVFLYCRHIRFFFCIEMYSVCTMLMGIGYALKLRLSHTCAPLVVLIRFCRFGTFPTDVINNWNNLNKK